MRKATVRDIDVKGKRVLVRVDFNVPIQDGKITDDSRIRAALPTIKYLLEEGVSIILCSHLGRPKGKVVEEARLRPVGVRLEELLGHPVKILSDCIGPAVEEEARKMKPGDVVLLENLRFHPEEEKNDPEFAKRLAALADIFVNDAFGTAHRAHASTEGVTRFLPSVSGFLMDKELDILGRLLQNPERPFVALLGGAKVQDKIGVLKNLIRKVDAILIGGGMAFTFLKVQGKEVGSSLVDENQEQAREILLMAKEKGIRFELPVDVVVAPEVRKGSPWKVVLVDEIPGDHAGVDIGPQTIERFDRILCQAKTIFWNGPMGIFEIEEFSKGTLQMAKVLAESHALTCVGGGDSVAAVEKMGLGEKMTHLSTGGGASLEFLEGMVLPGVAALLDRDSWGCQRLSRKLPE